MIEVPVTIAANMESKLARPIFGKAGQLLLPEGTVISPSYAWKLERMGIHNAFIEGGKVEAEDPVNIQNRINAMKAIQEVAKGKGAALKVNIDEVVQNILQDILTVGGILEKLADISTLDGEIFLHSVDVCALSMCIGKNLGYSNSSLLALGVGALLHDIGKLKLPQHLLTKKDLTETEWAEIRKHPQLGMEIIQNNHKIEERSKKIILEHHERIDGSGYPQQKKGKKITLFSSICGIADMYSAMTAYRDYRDALPPHEVYEYLLGQGPNLFPFAVVDAFARSVVPYPRGTIVKLSNDELAQVSRNNTGHPYLPEVIMLKKELAKKEKEAINLVEAGLTVKQHIDWKYIGELMRQKKADAYYFSLKKSIVHADELQE